MREVIWVLMNGRKKSQETVTSNTARRREVGSKAVTEREAAKEKFTKIVR